MTTLPQCIKLLEVAKLLPAIAIKWSGAISLGFKSCSKIFLYNIKLKFT